MKTKHIVLISLAIFLVLSIFGGTKSYQVKKLAAEKATLKAEFAQLEKQKEVSEVKLKELKGEFSVLEGQKHVIESELIKYKAETNKQIYDFKKRISEFNSLPTDTLYLDLFSMWPAFNQVLKYRFAENQVREMYLNVLERNNYENLYVKTTKSLVTCTDLNSKNNQIIGNLTDQNTNLTTINDLSELQVINLEDNLKLSDKTLNKQKRKTFFYKVTTVVAASGCFVLILK